MNPFQKLICNQYYELKQKGKEDVAKKQSVILSTIMLVILLLGTFMFLFAVFPSFEDKMRRLKKDIFGSYGGKSIGKLMVIVLFLISYPIIKITVGTEKYYHKTITYFNSLSSLEKEIISKKGIYSFFYTILFAVISVVILIIRTS